MREFKTSDAYRPTGDQPTAITTLADGLSAGERYQTLVDKFPESPHINLARYGLAMGHYRKGDVEKAHDLLEKIPPADRTGDLAAVPYVLADCCIRLAPTDALRT